MSWRPHSRAKVNALAPVAWAQCDRCSFWYNRDRLQWQFQYAGPNLQNLYLLVCPQCLDTPQPQLKPRILPPDPTPISNPRPPDLDYANNSYITTQDGDPIVTQDGLNIVQQQNFDIPEDFPD